MKNLGNLSLCKTSATSDNTELLSFRHMNNLLLWILFLS